MPAHSPLVGMQETRALLDNISKQAVHYLVREGHLVPLQKLKCGFIFLKSDVEAFAKKRRAN